MTEFPTTTEHDQSIPLTGYTRRFHRFAERD
jgi:hypothetical protein